MTQQKKQSITSHGKRITGIGGRPLILGAIVLSTGTSLLGGCQKALFSERQPRTQYEQYDRMHGTYVPATITDRNGNPRPALRERLRPPQG